MLIRDFTLKDRNNLKTLALKCWLFTYKNIYSEQKIKKMVDEWYSGKIHKEYLELMKKGKAIAKIAEGKGMLLGFISTEEVKGMVELKRLYVDPKYIRSGIGSKLLDTIEEILKKKGSKKYFCFVHRQNKIGQNFYKKKGFTIDELLSNNEDFYMSKNLQ